MPGYEDHNKFTIFLAVFLIGALVGLYDPRINLSLKDAVLFIGWAVLHMVLITPDFNWNSTPNKRLGPLGYVFRVTIKGHRENFTHAYWFWSLYFILVYFLIGWWTVSGILPIFSHLILDKETTKVARFKNRIKRMRPICYIYKTKGRVHRR